MIRFVGGPWDGREHERGPWTKCDVPEYADGMSVFAPMAFWQHHYELRDDEMHYTGGTLRYCDLPVNHDGACHIVTERREPEESSR